MPIAAARRSCSSGSGTTTSVPADHGVAFKKCCRNGGRFRRRRRRPTTSATAQARRRAGLYGSTMPSTGRIRLAQGDITAQDVDAIVNAANSSLLGGGGVDGAIHRAGGPAILEECRRLGGCETGEAKATDGRPARGAVRDPHGRPGLARRRRGEDEALASCHRASLAVAAELGCRTVAFPAISTGVYGFPLDRAAGSRSARPRRRSTGTPEIEQVTFVLFDGDALRAFEPRSTRSVHRPRSSVEEHRASTPGAEVRPLSRAYDTVAERRGTRLQSAARRFDSARCLRHPTMRKEEAMSNDQDVRRGRRSAASSSSSAAWRGRRRLRRPVRRPSPGLQPADRRRDRLRGLRLAVGRRLRHRLRQQGRPDGADPRRPRRARRRRGA